MGTSAGWLLLEESCPRRRGGRAAIEPVVSHRSALELWHQGWLPGRPLTPHECDMVLSEAPTAESAALVREKIGAAAPVPLDVAVMDRTRRRRIKNLTVHATVTSRGLPTPALVEAWHPSQPGRVLVVEPAWAWAQAAPFLDPKTARERLWELCGIYREDPNSPFGLTSRAPLTTVEQCRRAAAAINGGTVTRTAGRLLVGALDRLGSPAEGRAGCLMTTSRRQGGYGLPAPLANPVMALDPDESALMGQDTMSPDFFWPRANVVVEYDSNSVHFGRDAAAHARHDAHKRNVYEGRHWSCFTLTWDQLSNPATCDLFMKRLAEALDVVQRPLTVRTVEQRQRLWSQVFGPSRY